VVTRTFLVYQIEKLLAMQENHDIVESSASIIAKQLFEQQGITRSDICGADISEIYRDLTVAYPPANFTRASEMLAGVDQVSGDDPEPFWGVIVETRKHPALETVISSVLEVCKIPVQLFHGSHNIDFIMSTSVAGMVERGQVVLSRLNADHVEPRDYNGILMSPSFWKCMHGRGKILVFQTDSLCCRNSRYRLNDFSEFDYIGCTWARQRPVGLTIDAGNGGFSLRDWAMSMKCIACFDPIPWPGGEDGYYAFHMDLMGAHVATQTESGKFGTQEYFLDKSLGGHRVGLLKPMELWAFMSYCPEAKDVFPWLA